MRRGNGQKEEKPLRTSHNPLLNLNYLSIISRFSLILTFLRGIPPTCYPSVKPAHTGTCTMRVYRTNSGMYRVCTGRVYLPGWVGAYIPGWWEGPTYPGWWEGPTYPGWERPTYPGRRNETKNPPKRRRKEAKNPPKRCKTEVKPLPKGVKLRSKPPPKEEEKRLKPLPEEKKRG